MTVKELINQLQKLNLTQRCGLRQQREREFRPTQCLTISSNVTTAILRLT